MSYVTVFIGRLKINGEVTPELISGYKDFLNSPELKKDNGTTVNLYPKWKEREDVSEWCPFDIVEDYNGYYLEWNGMEEAYNPQQWAEYISNNFFVPKGLSLLGVILAIGESRDEVYYIIANEDEVAGYLIEEEIYEKGADMIKEFLISLKASCEDEEFHDSIDKICNYMFAVELLISFDTDNDIWCSIFDLFCKAAKSKEGAYY